MLSLLAIILPAAVRTEIWVPAGTVSNAEDPTVLPSSVMVSWSSQDSVPACDGFGDRVEHVQLENRCQRQGFGGVGAGQLFAAGRRSTLETR